jgi:hypothetical protein
MRQLYSLIVLLLRILFLFISLVICNSLFSINTFVYLLYFPSLLLLHSIQFSPIIPTLSQGQHLPPSDRCSHSTPVATLRVSPRPPPPPAVLILYSSNLFICIFNFYCWFICILFIQIYPYLFLLDCYSIPYMFFQLSLLFAALRCLYPPLSHPGSTLLAVTTSHVLLPCRTFQNLCYRLSFLLGLLTLEDGTDTLSRNVGKQLPHDAA